MSQLISLPLCWRQRDLTEVLLNELLKFDYSKTCVKRPSFKRPKLFFKTNYRLMQVKSIAECSKWSILQYFRPAFSYHLSLRCLFCLFLSGRFTQVLLYSFMLSEMAFYSMCMCLMILLTADDLNHVSNVKVNKSLKC